MSALVAASVERATINVEGLDRLVRGARKAVLGTRRDRDGDRLAHGNLTDCKTIMRDRFRPCVAVSICLSRDTFASQNE